MSRFFAALLLAVASVAPALADEAYERCLEQAGETNVAMGECGTAWLQREDERLNAAWKRAFALTDGPARADFLDEQRAWNAYKEKACILYTSGEFGREGQVLHYPVCRAKVLAQRTRELQGFEAFLKPQ